jgi:hypothetical protein
MTLFSWNVNLVLPGLKFLSSKDLGGVVLSLSLGRVGLIIFISKGYEEVEQYLHPICSLYVQLDCQWPLTFDL